MTEEGGKSRSSSLEKQRRFLGRDRYMGFQDEPLHGSDSGGPWPEQAQRAASGIPLDVRVKTPRTTTTASAHAAPMRDCVPGMTQPFAHIRQCSTL